MVSGSLTRCPTLSKNQGANLGSSQSATAVAAPNSASQASKCANTMPSASTVPRSVMKQAARMILPSSVLLKPVSTITA